MGPKWKLRIKRRLHRPRLGPGFFAITALATVATGSLITAPGSQAISRATGSARFRRAVASWYWDDGYGTACGFHARHGVANRTLPCGTHVTFLRAGHRVTAVVDDRGPYVAGRTWDLDEQTALALHFRRTGVGYVWARW